MNRGFSSLSNHTLIINEKGEVYSVGLNNEGQLGLGHKNNQYTPTKISIFGDTVLCIACGCNHSLVLTTKGLFAFGRNSFGQLGVGNNNLHNSPQKISSIPESEVLSITCGSHHSMILTNSGIFTWGQNSEGELGLGDNTNRNSPQKVPGFSASDILGISCGGYHSMVLSNKGLFTWGRNVEGQLGFGTNQNKNSPGKIATFRPENILAISCGGYHSIVLTQSGIYVWGNNSFGELGLGNNTNQNTPQKLPVFQPAEILSISCGWNHTIFFNEKRNFYLGEKFRGSIRSWK